MRTDSRWSSARCSAERTEIWGAATDSCSLATELFSVEDPQSRLGQDGGSERKALLIDVKAGIVVLACVITQFTPQIEHGAGGERGEEAEILRTQVGFQILDVVVTRRGQLRRGSAG